jgi:putative RecB family exonuclease
MDLSFSVIKAYTFCPFKYKLVYEDRWYTAPTPGSSLGHSIHRALDDYHRRSGKTFDELMESYNGAWVNEGFDSAQAAQECFEKGEKILKTYWEQSIQAESEIICTEKEFRFGAGKYFVRGTIDRIDKLPGGKYELIEYKTHANMWSQQDVDKDLQLSLYAHAARVCFEVEPTVLSYYFLAHNKKVDTVRSREQIEGAVKLAEEVGKKLDTKSFDPNTESCRFCDLKNKCPKSTVKKTGAENV